MSARFSNAIKYKNLTTEAGRQFFLETNETVAVGEKGECFGSRGKTHVSTFLHAVLDKFVS